MGRLEAIWIKRARRGPMDPVGAATFVADRGIEGNVDQDGWRQVTVLSTEAWGRTIAEVVVQVDPAARRANLLVRGVELRETRGRILAIGRCRIRIRGETRPCERMDDAHPGLKEALKPEWRGGVYGTVLDDGEVTVGDPVQWIQESGVGWAEESGASSAEGEGRGAGESPAS